jgi:ATP-dependent protease ClpP protease subunit
MTNRALPAVPQGRPQIDVRSFISPLALNRWDSSICASAERDADERTIGIYDVIGHDYWTGEGFTAKRMAAALRSLGKGPVTVAINSPGGDMFDGIAMYSMLKEHRGDVTVKVVGLAASSASVIAMAGDDVQIARPAFLMIHNCWSVGVGNRHDFAALSEQLRPFDEAMADVYAARTGGTAAAMAALMDLESWIGGSASVEQGFADSLLSSEEIGASDDRKSASAIRRMESALRASGMPKSEAMRLISQFKSSAGDPAGTGEGEPTEHGRRDAADIKQTVALATSLTSVLQGNNE